MAKGAKERNLKASADAIRKVLGEKPIKAEDKYSVELEKLLHDLEERPATLLKESAKLRGRIQGLRAPERIVWYDKLKEFTGQQKEKFDKLVNKWGFNV